MPWLFLLLAIAAFAIAMSTQSVALAMVCLAAALVFLAIWVLSLLAQRVGNQTRDDTMMIDPQELRRLREEAEARRAAAGAGANGGHDGSGGAIR